MKTIQKFSQEYLEECSKLSTQEILQFLEDFKSLHQAAGKQRSRLISLKVAYPLLQAFRVKCQLSGVKYQTQIKKLMEDWMEQNS